jgi:hypothetical protein
MTDMKEQWMTLVGTEQMREDAALDALVKRLEGGRLVDPLSQMSATAIRALRAQRNAANDIAGEWRDGYEKVQREAAWFEKDCRRLAAERDAANARIAALEAQLATARADAIRLSAIECMRNATKAKREGRGDFIAHEIDADAILALLATPAPAEVTVGEAAQVLLDLLYMEGQHHKNMTQAEVENLWRVTYEKTGFAAVTAALRALAGDRT